MKKLVGMLMVTALSAMLVRGATYYVDYDGGSDSNTGTSTGSAWKHAPGDASATGNAKMTPAAGDVIMLKGGVHYRGRININFNGTSGSPITYKGDGWGTGKAIIDGSDIVTGWTKCASADDAGGNENWANIWYADVPAGIAALEANLFLGDSLAYVAQYPNQDDPWWMDNRTNYLVAASISKTACISSELTAIGTDLLKGHIYVDVTGNNVDNGAITNFGGQTITFAVGHDAASSKKFSIANVINDIVFDREGEYFVDESAAKVYVWPWSGTDPNTQTVTVSVRQEVMQFNGSDYIVVDGIRFIKTTGKVSYANGNNYLTIKNCDYHHCRSGAIDNTLDLVNQTNLLVEDCTFWRNARMRGVVARRSGNTHSSATVQNNSFVRLGRTAIFLYEIDGGKIIGNHTDDGRGVHSNAYSCYSDHASTNPCRNIEIKNNTAINSNNSLTFYGVDTMLIQNNLFDGTGTDWPVSCWNSSNSLNVTMYHNNFVNSGTSREGFFALPEGSANMPTLKMRNNIVDGLRNMNADVSHQVYTTYAPNNSITIGADSKLDFRGMNTFADWQNGDWSLKVGAWAIDNGEDVGVTEDVAGNVRPYGSGPDIGCYEWSPTGIGHPGQGDLHLGGLVIPCPVQAMAGAIIIKKAIIEKGADQVGLFSMVGQPVDVNNLKPGFFLLKNGGEMRKIVVVE